MTDFRFENHGSIYLCRPLTDRARQHLSDVAAAAPDIQFFGNAMVVEPRYVEGVIDSLLTNDFNV